MNADQKKNVEESIRVIGEALFSAWSYVHLLRGLQAGAISEESKLKQHALAVDVIYRATFDALFAAIGTIVDRTKGTHSIPNLVSMIRRYGMATGDARKTFSNIESSLTGKPGTPLHKIENWRHKTVAHRTRDGRADDFYTTNKLRIDEVAELLSALEHMVNQISVQLLAEGFDFKSGSSKCEIEAKQLLAPDRAPPVA
jgi:hypothetical protein